MKKLLIILLFLTACSTYQYKDKFSNYFYQDHYIQATDNVVLLYENFYDNQFTYNWAQPSWDIWNNQIFKNSQVKLQDNTLILTTDTNIVSGEPHVKCGEITACKFLNKTYGFYEVCMKPANSWDAAWLFQSANLPDTVGHYEIDFGEFCNGSPNKFSSTIWQYTQGNCSKIIASKAYSFRKPLTNNYHTFGCDWRSDHVDIYLDGILLWHYTGTIPNTNMFLWINIAYSGGKLPISNYTKQIRVQY